MQLALPTSLQGISLLMRDSGSGGLLWASMRLTSWQQHTKLPVGQHVSHVQAVAKRITTLRTKQARQEKECGSAPEVMVSVCCSPATC